MSEQRRWWLNPTQEELAHVQFALRMPCPYCAEDAEDDE